MTIDTYSGNTSAASTVRRVQQEEIALKALHHHDAREFERCLPSLGSKKAQSSCTNMFASSYNKTATLEVDVVSLS